jgi:hypothetical protein
MSRPLPRRQISLLLIVALAFLACYPIIQPFGVVTAQPQNQLQVYCREFAWNFGGEYWTWNLSIPAALYEQYVSVPDSVRTQKQLSDFGYFTTTEDSYLQILVGKINETATKQGYSPIQEVNFALAFVQSIPYATDLNSTGYSDYPRFPIETLVDNIGDCKSHSILFATLTLMLGYGTVFINPPDHLAVGVLGNNLQGTYWTYDNQTYYYCETTASGYTVGQLPQEFNGQGAYVYPIDTSEQYTVNFQSSSTEPDPTFSLSGSNTPTTPNTGSNSLTTPYPTVAAPTIQPIAPISLNVIAADPVFFTLIVAAIGVCVAVVVKPVRAGRARTAPQQTVIPEPSSPQTEETVLSKTKFCIYCGSSNKSYALYCENCGKKIA